LSNSYQDWSAFTKSVPILGQGGFPATRLGRQSPSLFSEVVNMGRFRENPDPESNDHPYDQKHFAAKHGLTAKAAEVILLANGPSRVACDAAARAFVQAIGVRSDTSKQRRR
jgi:hypothetical protein